MRGREAIKLSSYLGDYIKNRIKNKIKSAAKKALKKLIISFYPYIIASVGIIVGGIFILGVVQGFFVDQVLADNLTPQENSSLKTKLLEKVEEANNNNTFDIYGNKIGSLVDYYNTDSNLKLSWVYIISYMKYIEIAENKSPDNIYENDPSNDTQQNIVRNIEKIIGELKPKFIYKKDQIIKTRRYTERYSYIDPITGETKYDYETKTETTKEDIYLLVKAETIKGTYNISYKPETTVSNSGGDRITLTTPVIDNFQQTDKDYDRLKSLILSKYPNTDNTAIEEDVAFIVNIALNYQNQSDNMDWVFADIAGFEGGLLDTTIIPASLLPFYKKADSKFGVPWWFSGAVSFVASKYDIKASNPMAQRYGLMQLTQDDWARASRQLGYDPVYDKDNPEAQILAGVYILKENIGQLQWSDNWQEPTISGLTSFAGYESTEVCRENYAKKVWEYARTFQNLSELAYNPRWPVEGYTSITSPFGIRSDPFTGAPKMHNGIDVGAPSGARVKSSMDGTVTFAGPAGTYGILVKIQDNAGNETRCAHLQRTFVTVGQQVKIGDLIAAVDSTGASTGNHLHYEVIINGKTTDPVTWLINNK